MNPTIKLSQSQAWNALADHHQSVRELHLRQLFADDPKRGERMTVEAVGLYLDYSKNRVTDETLKLLVQLADESGLRRRIDAMFRGEKINITENRAVLHMALRAPLAIGYLEVSEAIKRPSPGILLRCRPMLRKWRSSELIPPTCSSFGIGSAGAIRWTRRSGFRR